MTSPDQPLRRVRGTSEELEQAAHGHRHSPTLAEAMLWSKLRGGRLHGLKFRRQHPLGTFILDFCCVTHRLVIEVDGGIHNQPAQAEHDAARTATLEAFGYRVLRFENREVMTNLSQVLRKIAEVAGVSNDSH